MPLSCLRMLRQMQQSASITCRHTSCLTKRMLRSLAARSVHWSCTARPSPKYTPLTLFVPASADHSPWVLQRDTKKTTADYHGEAQEPTRHMMHTPQTADAPLLDLRDPGAGPPVVASVAFAWCYICSGG